MVEYLGVGSVILEFVEGLLNRVVQLSVSLQSCRADLDGAKGCPAIWICAPVLVA